MSDTKVNNQFICDQYAVWNGDCVEIARALPDDKIGLTVTSLPFLNLYSYSDSRNDMGNCKSSKEFFKHFRFLADELLRITMPGRLVCIHCCDVPLFKNQVGYVALADFPGDIVNCFKETGFYFVSRHVIWKDPLIAATRTKAKGLAHQQLVKDSAQCRMGIPDMILGFQKPGDNPKPIKHPKGLTEYAGKNPIPKNLDAYVDSDVPRENKRSHWIWQSYASPVWTDINQTKVLPFRESKDKDDTAHICPLQLQVITRLLVLWSNKGDVVFDPFGGVGSTAYEAVRNDRKAVMSELKGSYYRQALRNLKSLGFNSGKGKGFGFDF